MILDDAPETLADKNGTPVAVGDLIVTPTGSRVVVRDIVAAPSAFGGWKFRYYSPYSYHLIHPAHVVKVPS